MLSEKLTQLRSQKNVTQQQMADMLDITRPAYTAYESGTRKPEYDSLIKIADYFQVSIDFLLGRTSNKQFNQSVAKKNTTNFDGNKEQLTNEETEYLKMSLEVFRRYNETKRKKAEK